MPLAGAVCGSCADCSVAVVIINLRAPSFELRASWGRSIELVRGSKLAARSLSRLSRFHCNRLGGFLLLLPVPDRGADGVLSQHRTMDLNWRKRQFLHDIHVLDGEGFIHRLALDPLGGERRRRDRGATAERLELGFFNDVGLAVHLDLQLQYVPALGCADQAGADVGAALIHGADVTRIVVMIDYFIAV